MITSLLVANRGEIARRVFRTCRDLGLATVAVYSDADAAAAARARGRRRRPAARQRAADTYLRADLLVEAARRAGRRRGPSRLRLPVGERRFAGAVLAAGLTWIGPPPAAIAAMGSKIESKRLMAAARACRCSTTLDPGAARPKPTCRS